jgi:hypothetical protein
LREAEVREQARQEAETRNRQRNIDALHARQEHLLPIAATAAAAIANTNESVWVGVPATGIDLTKAPARLDLVDALGNEKTARGAAIWIGPDSNNLRLFAVLSPIASQITPGLAASCRRRTVRVYVADERQAVRVARALGWRQDQLQIARANEDLLQVSDWQRERLDEHRQIEGLSLPSYPAFLGNSSVSSNGGTIGVRCLLSIQAANGHISVATGTEPPRVLSPLWPRSRRRAATPKRVGCPGTIEYAR